MKHILLTLVLGVSLSACKYSNEFTGTFNNQPATMSAYSKNVNKYCVALNLTAGSLEKLSYISAQAAIDENDFLKPKAFNTKGAPCSASLEEYLVGIRTVQVFGNAYVTRNENAGADWCRSVTYRQYDQQESIHFDMKKNANDELVGTFEGKGIRSWYTDYDHPVSYGPVYYCGPSRPYPGPGGPWPRGPGGYPRPWPYLNHR